MRIIILIIIFIVGISTADTSLSAQIQIGSGMKMKVSVDDEATQLWKDIINRRVRIYPENTTISETTKKVQLEFHNPSNDTIEIDITVSNILPPITKAMNMKIDKPASHRLLEQSDYKLLGYKPLDKLIISYPNKLKLSPGEKKSIDVDVAIPDSIDSGEYVCWIVAEVAPRKTLLAKYNERKGNPKQVDIPITVSSSKIVFNASKNNKPMPE